MYFNSFHFIGFYALVLAVVALLAHRIRARNAVLLVASYYFYACWDWRFLVLIGISTVVDYFCGLAFAVDDLEVPPPRSRKRDAVLLVSVGTNLGLLGFFKYFDFFVDSGAAFLTALQMPMTPRALGIILPVGISFYTLQTLSYTIDVYRGKTLTERDPITFALFVAFFPQLVAGPIERAKRLLPQLRKPSVIDGDKLNSGFYLMGWGLFKKTVLADNVALVVDQIWSAPEPSGVAVLLGLYCFAIQLYCDFSAYSDIARGAARCMGFELMLNFDLPFSATNPTEFWRRWHISLSTWLRDYLYFPLGGGRKGRARAHFNLVLTMVVSGVWHGAGWPFFLMGLTYGLQLSIHKELRPWLDRIQPSRAAVKAGWYGIRVVAMLHLFTLPLIFFRSLTMEKVLSMSGSALSQPLPATWGVVMPWLTVFGWVLLTLAAMEVAQKVADDHDVVARLPVGARALVYAAMILGIIVFGVVDGEAFVYFQF